jgi:ribonuclease HIII
MQLPGSFTFNISEEQGRVLKSRLAEDGFEFAELAHGHFLASRRKCKVAYYKSGKLVVQGKDGPEWIEFSLEPFVLGEAKLGYDEVHDPAMFEPHFGVDESGKGDFFGPLVVAGAYVDRDLAYRLLDLGVKDSKKITSDRKAKELAGEIRKVLAGRCEVLAIGPERYNEMYGSFGNLNRMLAWAHGRIIELMKVRVPTCPRALSDQFANPRLIERELEKKGIAIHLDQRTKAESDVAVAAASILARAGFLERLERLGKPLELVLAKGASSLVKEQAVEIVQKHGVESLAKVAKKHFKTFNETVEAVRGRTI